MIAKTKERFPWMISLHGGHSGEFCDHAEGSLHSILTAAVEAGFHTFGVSEHAPRGEPRFLYPEETRRGWDAGKIAADFMNYKAALPSLVEEFADRLVVLKGFEAEVVPAASYAGRMRDYRDSRDPFGAPAFDYCVGSVHYVRETQIDGEVDAYLMAIDICGGLEAFAVEYYRTVAAMIVKIQPEVVGHLDLITKKARDAGFTLEALQTPKIQAAADLALEAAKGTGAILDLNTAGWRKGLPNPYPAPWLVRRAAQMEISFCFGDDSHRTGEVGSGIPEARLYLLNHGVRTITALAREASAVVHKVISLED